MTVNINSHTRPHIFNEAKYGTCWCNPRTCECCGGREHRDVDLRPDYSQRHMGVFSEQIAVRLAV